MRNKCLFALGLVFAMSLTSIVAFAFSFTGEPDVKNDQQQIVVVNPASDEKIVSDDLTKLDGSPAFLLMKQAISTGWDCPRAKILVKLREGGSEDFQIQTIGRIRRMPEGKHYGLNILDYCYIYTLDTQYKMGLLSALDKAYQVRRLFLRDEAKDFTITKEMRDLDFDGLGERETLEKVYAYFKEKYNLGSDKKANQENLEAGGYNFSHEIDNKILQGIFRTTEDLARSDSDDKIKIKTTVNTHTHGIYLLHSVDEIKKVNKELINVATSRAKDQLVILSDIKELKRLHSAGDDDIYELVDYVQTNGEAQVTARETSSRALGIKPYSTQTEAAFLTTLNHALDNVLNTNNRCVVQREVSIAHVFQENESYDDLFYTGRFDFVVYEKGYRGQDMPILAIELD